MKATQSRDTIDKTTNKCYNYLDRVTDTEKNDGRDERLSDEQNKNKLTDAEKTAEIMNIPVKECLIKTRETKRQAKLNGEQRRKNLIGAFKVIDKSAVKDKTALIIDDVTTTGATAEAIAEALKKAGARSVLLATVAGVSFIKDKKTVKK